MIWTVLVLTALAGGAGCRGLAPARAGRVPAAQAVAGGRTRVFQVAGTVEEVRVAEREVIIRHEEIPGYMSAMTMPFAVKDSRELAGLQPGDRVGFRLTVTPTEGWIDRVTVRESPGPEDAKPVVPSVRRVRLVDELKEGDTLPDYPFVDEQRRRVRLGQFRGQALALTFIYTRCPFPAFCPRQSRQFAEVSRQLKSRAGGPRNWRLLSISFDPEHDTPSVLRRYARQCGYDPEHWSFLTGQIIDIDALTEQFGMFYARDGSGFSHNIRTVIVNAAGRIQKVFVGNDWQVDDVVAELINAAGP
jgi:protein SCO1/2